LEYIKGKIVNKGRRKGSMDTSPVLSEKHNLRKMSYVLIAIGCILLVIAFLIGINDNPLAIVSMLVGFFSVVLGFIYFLKKFGKRKPAQELLYWTPRALCITYAVFISIFALDVFKEGQGFWITFLGLLMHLIPTFLILIVLAVSWRREWIGGILFIVLGVLYVVTSWNKPFGHLSTFLLIAGPLVLAGALFLFNWHYRSELRGSST
jgi:uncharacterized membrane protein HdeD (DUF308 family)